MLKIIPIGKHTIVIVSEKNTDKTFTLLSHESGTIAKTWNHTIVVEKISPNEIEYTDEVYIKAGVFTAFVWCFASLFYRFRHRNWKKRIKSLDCHN